MSEFLALVAVAAMLVVAIFAHMIASAFDKLARQSFGDEIWRAHKEAAINEYPRFFRPILRLIDRIP